MAEARRSRVKRTLAVLFGALLGLVVLAMIVVSVMGERWANSYARERADELSRTLGRPVTYASLKLAPLRGELSLERLAIGPAGDEPNDAPPLELASASLDVAMWRTLLSFGREPTLESVELRGLRAAVVKRADGTLNWQHIADKLGAPEAEEQEPVDLRIKAARLQDGMVRFIDSAHAEREARIADIALSASNLGGSAELHARLTAALLAPEPNLRLEARIRDGAAKVPRIERLDFTLEPVELAPLAPFLSALGPAYQGFAHGVLSASVAASTGAGEQTALVGELALQQAEFEGGKPFAARLELDVGIDAEKESVRMRNVAVRAADMVLGVRGTVYDVSELPRARDVEVYSGGLSFDALRTIYPGLDRATAPARLTGPFVVSARGSGSADAQELSMTVDLTPAEIQIEELFHKPARVPLVVSARARSRPDAITFAPASLTLADFRLLVEGTVSELEQEEPRFQLRISTPNPAAASLLRLLPKIQKSAAKAGELPGTLSLEGTVQGRPKKLSAAAKLALSGFALELPEAAIEGAGSARMELRREGELQRGELHADFSAMRLRYGDELHKPKGAPMKIDAKLAGEEASVAATLSSLKVGDVRITTHLRAKQTLGRPQTLALHVTRFAAQAGKSDLKGTLRLTNLNAPQVVLSAEARYLDLDDFLPASTAGGASSEPARTSEEPLVARASGTAELEVQKGLASGIPYENLRAKLTLRKGRARAEQLQLAAFGGTFSGNGTEIPLLEGKGPYVLRGSVKQLGMEPMLAELAGVRDILRGSLSAGLDVSARGLTPDALLESLTGKLKGKVDDAVFLRGNAASALTRKLRSAAEVPALERALTSALGELGSDQQGWQLKDLQGAARFDKGAMVLTEPITADTPQGKVTLQGRLGLTSATKLDGTFAVNPQTVALLSKGKVKLGEPVLVPFQVTGSLSRPAFAFSDLEPVLRPMLRAYLLEEGERQLDKRVDDLLDLGRAGAEPRQAPRREQPKREAQKNLQKETEKQLRGLLE